MGHRNARLSAYARRLIVHRVRVEGMPVAHVAKAMGVSHQCAHRWIARFDAEGDAGLEDRSSRPHRTPTRTSADVEQQVVALRQKLRVGPDRVAPQRLLGIRWRCNQSNHEQPRDHRNTETSHVDIPLARRSPPVNLYPQAIVAENADVQIGPASRSRVHRLTRLGDDEPA